MPERIGDQISNLTVEELQVLARFPIENPNPILRIGFNGNLLWANQAFLNLPCFRQETIGLPVGESLRIAVEKTIQAGKAMDTEIRDDNLVFLFNLLPVTDIQSVFLYGRDITARKQAERELKQMALIAGETGNAVVITDPEGRVEWVNRSFEIFTGYTLGEVRGKIPGSLLQGPDTDPAAVEKMARAIQGRQSVEQDVINYSKSGNPYWVSIQIQPIFSQEGELINFISIQKDITKEKTLQQEIEQNENKLRMILESALDGVIIIDDQSLVLTWTRQTESIFGFSADEVTGKRLGDLIVPERMREAHHNGMNRYLATGVPKILNRRIEITGLRKSGEEFPLELTVIPIRDKNRLIFCAFTRDISQQKQAQLKLGTTTSRLSSLITNLNAGVLVEDENRTIALINNQFCSMFGIPADPAILIGTDCSRSAELSKDMFKDPDGFIDRIDDILSRHELQLNDELELKDGRFFKRDYVPVFADGIFLGNLWQYEDITRRKQNERLLELARTAAEEANQAKSAFLANMSHEIRTPMNAVHGIVRLLAEAPHLPEQKDLHQRLIASSETLLMIINDILDFSKVEAGLMTLEKTPFSISDVITRVISQMEIKATQKSLSLLHAVDENIAPVLEGDPVRLGQVLLNLVNNAVKFTDQGQVSLSCRLVSADNNLNTIRFSVIDTGIGIDAEQIGKIFESYQQEALSTTRQFGGTGLGLTISRQLVELMGGELLVESEKNRGSTFHFTIKLTCIANNSSLEPAAEIIIDPEKLRGCKVLIVEDNEMNQFVAKSILKKWNLEVFQVSNGRKAIEFLSEKECDIVLMDKQMPVMGGVEATRYIRETMKSSIPIIALTADAVIEMVQECLAAGMNDYVTKPFEPAVLYGKIIQVLETALNSKS